MMRLVLTGIALCFYAVVALAAGGFGVGNNLTGFWQSKSLKPPSLSFVSCSTVSDTTSPLTYTNHATGTAGNRWTIVGVAVEDQTTSFTINSMTVGGVSATELVDNSADTGSLMQSAFYIVSNPSGTTATISVTVSESVTDSIICVWAAYDLTSAAAHATASQFQTTSANLVLSLNIPTTGFGVGLCAQNGTAVPTWAGMAQRVETLSAQSDFESSAADTTTVGTPLTVGCDWDSSNDAVGVSASFK